MECHTSSSVRPITVMGRPLKAGSLHRMAVWIMLMSDPIEWLWAISWIEIMFVRWSRCSPQVLLFQERIWCIVRVLGWFLRDRHSHETYPAMATNHQTALRNNIEGEKKNRVGVGNYITCKCSFQCMKIHLFVKGSLAQNHVNECRHPFHHPYFHS